MTIKCHGIIIIDIYERFLADTNECEHDNMHECDQRCVNQPGSFFCACYQGYSVAPNGTTCVG